MADTLSERLRGIDIYYSEERAALDEAIAIVTAAEAWAKAERLWRAGESTHLDGEVRASKLNTLLALLPEAD